MAQPIRIKDWNYPFYNVIYTTNGKAEQSLVSRDAS